MKKSSFAFVLFVLLGLLAGSLVGELLAAVPTLSFLTTGIVLEWHPKADLHVLQFDIWFRFRLHLLNLFGLVFAIWMYRKL